ncbi:hypothetical protein A2865_03100 [Candidatus Woesebacteria bacterium RIFCSPHIGHO2_01_FULL_39_17]|nr:MAG: hypothetical protein US72_C0018G0021 [Microgenomates group bacterium GW2011_GWC1_38_12]KKR13566.1 MAG: hypothetical protein UT40_C0014G0022 [Candidatus Woesebacteria bacterium GW2011_GWA1_39_21b]OGM22550.1 MAG: hypothetical protein A2865_03100 [Candidatus Woesebacteria bacterium RIFCSPHIGHO2_01_FULL_39_17]OGM63673.1 MAG: hypothetical protein A3A52_02515 [Candidatus Woesebacteria bacterium RIFCSPLOWO2_01_FULL_39_14]
MATREITFQIPTIDRLEIINRLADFTNKITSLKNRVGHYLSDFLTKLKERRKGRDEFQSTSLGNKRFDFSSSKLRKPLKNILLLIIALAIIFGIGKVVSSISLQNSSSGKLEVEKAKKSQVLNREFSFPLKDSQGEQIGEVKYMVEKAELMDEIIVEGKRAKAVKGRIFLIFTIKISNGYTQAIEMNTKDYARLSVNGNFDEWLAPDIHNDPVEVQAISTKYTRLGFPINENDKNLVLRIGEIEGEKQEIPLELK